MLYVQGPINVRSLAQAAVVSWKSTKQFLEEAHHVGLVVQLPKAGGGVESLYVLTPYGNLVYEQLAALNESLSDSPLTQEN